MKPKTTTVDWTALESLCRAMPHEELVQELILLCRLHFDDMASRSSLGGREKGKKSIPRRVMAAKQYIKLTASGKSISAQRLHDSLKTHYPNEKWNFNTIRAWHKKMRAGVSDVTK